MVKADSGTYKVPSQELELKGSVRLFHDRGYAFETASANVDLDRGLVSSRSDVLGHGPTGTIKGSGILIDNNEKSVFVRGPATLLLRSSNR